MNKITYYIAFLVLTISSCTPAIEESITSNDDIVDIINKHEGEAYMKKIERGMVLLVKAEKSHISKLIFCQDVNMEPSFYDKGWKSSKVELVNLKNNVFLIDLESNSVFQFSPPRFSSTEELLKGFTPSKNFYGSLIRYTFHQDVDPGFIESSSKFYEEILPKIRNARDAKIGYLKDLPAPCTGTCTSGGPGTLQCYQMGSNGNDCTAGPCLSGEYACCEDNGSNDPDCKCCTA